MRCVWFGLVEGSGKQDPNNFPSALFLRPGCSPWEAKAHGLHVRALRVGPVGHSRDTQVPMSPSPQPHTHTVLLRSIRWRCTHCIFRSLARFSGSTTPANPRFSSAYS